MKKFIVYPFLIILSLLLTLIITICLVLFFSPKTIINPQNLKWVLTKTHVLKSFSWQDAEFDHQWLKWNERLIRGHLKDFCFEYTSSTQEVNTCFDRLSWDFKLRFKWDQGLFVETIHPFIIHSTKFKLITLENPKPQEPSSPPDVRRYWDILWSDLVPDMDIRFESIDLISQGKTTHLDFALNKKARKLEAVALNFNLAANPQGFVLKGPSRYRLPISKPGVPELYLRDFVLQGSMEEKGVPLEARGAIDPVHFQVHSFLSLPLLEDFSSVTFRKKMMLATKAEISLKSVNKALKAHAPAKYHDLPAPFNVMDGDILTKITSSEGRGSEVLFQALTSIDLASPKQVFAMDVEAQVPLNAETFKPGAINLIINLRKITLQLPRLSGKSLPPQLKPDDRIKKGGEPPPETEKKSDLSLHLAALAEEALHLKTDLLDEPLRLNFDLFVKKGELQKGFVQVLPLKTKVFKRPVRVQFLKITFNHPLGPVLEGNILFPLPEYKITLKLEGPVSSPRHSFSSEPPLPQNDIYAVLLFGRPMADLGPDDKGAAQKTNQLLSQGILSLSVLYFLAGSPVEYVGFDPESNNATAQIGLGSKASLRVGGGSGGINSTGVRRALGKGWYLDTSVQSPSTTSGRSQNNYGVMLERIIAY